MRRVAIALVAVLLPTAVRSEDLRIDDLRGLDITADTVFQGRFRRGDKEGPGTITLRWRFKIDANDTITGNLDREVRTPRGTRSLNRKLQGKIGEPKQVAEGHSVWVLDKDTLTQLRVFEVGGQTASFKLVRDGKGWRCSLDAGIAKETGAGSTKTQAAFGGQVTMLSIRQKSSRCEVRG